MLHARMAGGWFGASFVISTLVVWACHPPEVPTAYRCRPSSPHPDKRCPEGEQCCSDDPASLDLSNLAAPSVPQYQGREGSGTPLFSAARNDDSVSGMCVRTGSVAPAFSLADAGPGQGCPIPCNPTWDGDSIQAVCGQGTFCCQTEELDESDCVFDPGLGNSGCWRPARGDDIEGLGGIDVTNWAEAQHATHQDPGGFECEAFVVGMANATDVQAACLRRLGVANQRGFCIGGPGVAGCPLAQPGYIDACEERNIAESLGGCD